MKTTLLIIACLLSMSAIGQETLKLDTASVTWGGIGGFQLSSPIVYDTIPSWLITTTKEDLATMTQRRGYAIKPRYLASGLVMGYFKPSELITIAYLDVDKKPITNNWIVWMSQAIKD